MHKEIYEKICKKYRNAHGYISSSMMEKMYFILIYLKYLCDSKKYTYEEVIKSESAIMYLEDLNRFAWVLDRFDQAKIYKLLYLIQFEDLKELIYEFINSKRDEPYFKGNDKDIICLTNQYPFSIYDLNGKTKYASYKTSTEHKQDWLFQILDKMLGINNQYRISIDEYDLKENTIIFINDELSKYRYRESEDILDLAYEYSEKYNKNKIIVKTTYKKIATIRYKYLYKNLKRIIIVENSDNVYMEYNDDVNDTVSIIMYDPNKKDAIQQLNDIIKKNRKHRNVLVKVNKEEINENKGKIGFRIYQDKKEEVRNINDIVLENNQIIEKLSNINERIQEEVDKLINR